MLTKTQLRTATTGELERLQARIEAELVGRRHQQESGQRHHAEAAKEQLFYSGHTGHYQWEYVQCGHKKRCKRCQSGRKHGPYLYRYFYRDGKQRSQYIKLSELHLHPEAPSRPTP